MRYVRLFLGGLLALAAALLSAGRAGPGYAAVFTVNSTADAVDANPGDGVCATAQGACTLRAAIQETNALPGPDSISLPSGIYGLTTPGRGEDAAATGDLDITDDLAITGAGAGADVTVIDGGGIDRVFHIVSGAVEVSAVTVRNGSASDGGGIFIEIDAVLDVVRAAVTGNRASGGGGGIFNDGAGTLVGRLAGTVTVAETTVGGNTAGLGGGGIANSGNLTVLNSTITGNSALHGGGIVNSGSDVIPGVWGVATVSNSIVSGNSASFAGGGVSSGGSMPMTNVTIANNSAPREAGISTGPFGGASLKNTIVASNSGGDCTDGLPVASAGHNLDSDGSCGLASPGDLSGVEPLLGPLADNGGATPTHALLAGSPAVDAADNSGCPAADQRGVARPADGDGNGVAVCDIGAYEAEAPLRRGDADCDNEVDAVDALFVLRRVAGLQPYAACIGAATVDCDPDTRLARRKPGRGRRR